MLEKLRPGRYLGTCYIEFVAPLKALKLGDILSICLSICQLFGRCLFVFDVLKKILSMRWFL